MAFIRWIEHVYIDNGNINPIVSIDIGKRNIILSCLSPFKTYFPYIKKRSLHVEPSVQA